MNKYILLATSALTLSATAYGQNGNVGIGTTSPQAKLQVAGTVIVDSLQNPTTDNYVVMAKPTGKLLAVAPSTLGIGGGAGGAYSGSGFNYMDGNLKVLKYASPNSPATYTLTATDYIIYMVPSGAPQAPADSTRLILPDPATLPQKLYILVTEPYSPGIEKLTVQTTTGGITYTKPCGILGGSGATRFSVKLKSDGVRWYQFCQVFIGFDEDLLNLSNSLGPAL